MKHILIALALSLTLVACSSEIQENRENRSTVYEGQTTGDLYENFGGPTTAERVSPDEVRFYSHREAITRDWTRMYYDWCDMTFVVVNDRVVDWRADGNQCFLKVGESQFAPNPDDSSAENADAEPAPVYEENGDAYYPPKADDNYRDTLF